MEIKIQCDCGQRYKFDVEPVNGHMPFTVNCPICGLDGTAKANGMLQQVLGISGLPPSGIPVAPPVAAATASAFATSQAASAGPARLRLSKAKEPETAAPALSEAPATAPTRPAPIGHAPQRAPVLVEGTSGRKPSFALGLLGALIGVVTGSLIYFAIFNYTGFRFKLLAVGVGYLTGLGAELLGRKEGSKELGMIAATLTLAGIVSAQYFVARNWWQSGMDTKPDKSAYETSVAEAKKVVTAVPTGSDQEIRVFLAKEDADPDEKPDPQSVSEEDVKAFRETTLPEMRDLASGKITKEQFDKKIQAEEAQTKDEKDAEEGTFKAVFLILLLSKLNLFSLCAAAGLAFKVCSNA
jgi:hypothetical protein